MIEENCEIITKIKEKLLLLLKDDVKVNQWLNCPNPNFGSVKPITLINIGRGNKVLLFIEAVEKGY